MARLTSAQWLDRLRGKGWTRSQIQAATGAAPSTQLRIQSGRTKSSRYEGAIRDAGSKYSRRATVPPEYPHTPKPHDTLDQLMTALANANLAPDEDRLDDMRDTFGSAGMRAILKGQLAAYRRYTRDGINTRVNGDTQSWFHHKGPDMMRRYSGDQLLDPQQYISQLFYAGIKP